MIFDKKIVKILKKVRKAHIEDIEISTRNNQLLLGLCHLSRGWLSDLDYYAFIGYLYRHTNKSIDGHVWDLHNTNTERLEWLDYHIKLEKK